MPMTNTQRDQLAQTIRSLSVVEMRDTILDNRPLFPECDGMSEAQITKLVARDHAHNRDMVASGYQDGNASMLWIVPAFLIVGTLVTGILSLMGI